MAFHDLKQTYKEWSGEPEKGKDEYYPCIYLDESSLDAMKVENLKAGTEVTFMATARVSSVSANANGSRSMSLELLEGSLGPKEKAPDASTVLFPNG
jgi:hypothetical protein